MSKEGLRKLISEMGRQGADGFLVFNRENSGQPGTAYLSRFWGSESLLLLTKRKNYIFTDGRYLETARKLKTGYSVRKLGKNLRNDLKRICEKDAVKKIIFDGERTAFSKIERMRKTLPEVSFKSDDNLLQKIRAVKDAGDLRLMKKSAEIACSAFQKLLPFIKPGRTEKEVAERMEQLLKKCGSEGAAFPTIVASGKNGALPHARPTNKKLRLRELVIIDFGARYHGYLSDMTRTIALGKITLKLHLIYEAVREAQAAGLAAASAEISGEELDAIVRRKIEREGFGKYFIHNTGHGLGLEIHELPIVSSGNKEKLPEHSVITIEPGIYLPGVGGVRIEDTVIVQKNDVQNLTEKITKELIIL